MSGMFIWDAWGWPHLWQFIFLRRDRQSFLTIFVLHVFFHFNGGEWDAWWSVSANYFPGVCAKPYVARIHHAEFIYWGIGGEMRPPNLMRENEREIELKFCSSSHTQWTYGLYNDALKSTHSNWEAYLTDLHWHSHLVMHSQMASFLMQDQSSHGLTPNLSPIDTQTDPNTHDYWSLWHTLYPKLISSLINERFTHVPIKMLIWDSLANAAVNQGVKACRSFVSLTGWSYWVFDLSFMKCQQQGSELK